MRHALLLQRQVTLADVYNAVSHLDVPAFLRQTARLVTYVPDLSDETMFVRGLLEVPFGDGTTVDELVAPYTQAGVPWDWCEVVLHLRTRGHSALAHPDALIIADYVIDGTDAARAPRLLEGRQRLLRPRARTLPAVLQRTPGAGDAVPPPRTRRSTDERFDALVAELVSRVRPTVGGDAYLAPNPAGRALAVLAASVAAIVGDRACQRSVGKTRVVRSDAYEKAFDALGLEHYVDVAREVLERDHPHHRRVSGPWPPGEGTAERDLAILAYESGRLTLLPSAVLQPLPTPGGHDALPTEEGDEDNEEDEAD